MITQETLTLGVIPASPNHFLQVKLQSRPPCFCRYLKVTYCDKLLDIQDWEIPRVLRQKDYFFYCLLNLRGYLKSNWKVCCSKYSQVVLKLVWWTMNWWFSVNQMTKGNTLSLLYSKTTSYFFFIVWDVLESWVNISHRLVVIISPFSVSRYLLTSSMQGLIYNQIAIRC